MLRDKKMGYQIEKNGAEVDHLFLMDNLKLYRKNDKEIGYKNLKKVSKDVK